eukprot:TRINITY_DN596_c0_g1_i1.p1 TRINITY_DN596_c0_g1~~TRINITY_DN596_c0_g1_i1.p1  ORF type:complete len:345 (+),score=64.11 TRINITY_DN596_c0_g1_i1:111-1037(+)
MGPAAKHWIARYQLNPEQIKGTGRRGRIFKHDVLEFVNSGGKASSKASQPAPKPYATVPPVGSPSAFEDIPNTNIRKVIAKRLTESKTTIPHAYLSANIVLDQLMELRSSMNAAHKIKLSVNDFVIRGCALALKDVPEMNASFNRAGELQLHKSADISVAVATESGLITPIVKNADSKGLLAISNDVKDLAAKAHANKLQPNEFQGGSFSVSNLGMFGVDEFFAVINPPQIAILAVGTAKKQVFANSDSMDNVSIATVLKVALSFDQRAVEGEAAARFLNSLKQYLENPHLLSGSNNSNVKLERFLDE